MDDNTKTQNQGLKFNISSTGQINFESSSVTPETAEIINQAINQAAHHKQLAMRLEQQKLTRQTEIDSVVILFVSSLMCIVMFASYMIAATIKQSMSQPQSVITRTITNV